MSRLILSALALALWVTALPPAAEAQVRDERLTRQLLQGLNPASGRGESLTPAEAARIAQQEHGGQVLAVEPAARGYRVKLLVEGEVRIVYVDERRGHARPGR